MKPHASTTLYRTGDIEARTVEMQVATDSAAIAALQDNLSNLYVRKEEAVVRELGTNANDAMRRAGHIDPVRITLEDDQLTISDSGTGMTADDVVNLYGTYGASDKRETDEQQGMFGFGAKAPFALVDEFTVTTTKANARTTLICRRNPDAANEMVFVEENVPTDSPSGTTISMIVPDQPLLVDALVRVYRYWREEDGYLYTYNDEPQRFDPRLEWSSWPNDIEVEGEEDVWHAVQRPVEPGIVQGGVHYRPPNSDIHHVFFVPVGSVDFTPPREGLKMTERTEDVLAAIYYWYECRPLTRPVEQQFGNFQEGDVYLSASGVGAIGVHRLYKSEPVTHIVYDVNIKRVNRNHTRWFPNDTVLWINSRAWRCEMWARERWPKATMETYAEAKAANKSTSATGSRPIMYGGLTLAEARDTPNLVVLGEYASVPDSFLRGKVMVRLTRQQKMSTARQRLPNATYWEDYSLLHAQCHTYLAGLANFRRRVCLTEHANAVINYDRKWYWRLNLNWHRPMVVRWADHRVDKHLDQTIKREYPVLQYLTPETPTEIIDLVIAATKETITS